ncbi:restriction endonuclease subunit S [Vibrio cholerae O1]|nr:restriction endonuclease subunit S [Vibrio cholerae O1]
MIHKFKINSQGLTSDTWNLKYKQLKNINIDIHVLEEQEKIGDFFKKMDI